MLAIKQQTNQSRLGMVVAKKNISKSVERNRIKRLIRESFRHARLQLPGLDIVVLIRKGFDNVPNLVISSKIDALWKDLQTKAVIEPESSAQAN
jgi:ribonuclease P protein component